MDDDHYYLYFGEDTGKRTERDMEIEIEYVQDLCDGLAVVE